VCDAATAAWNMIEHVCEVSIDSTVTIAAADVVYKSLCAST
jgi:hypothetical protein